MHEVLVDHLGGLSLPRKSVARLTDRPDMTLDVYHGRITTSQQQQQPYGYVALGNLYLCLQEHPRSVIKVKPVLVATSTKQATCIKQACLHFPKKANTL